MQFQAAHTLVARRSSYEVRQQAKTILSSYACVRQPTLHADEREDLAKYILESDNLAEVLIRTARQVYQ